MTGPALCPWRLRRAALAALGIVLCLVAVSRALADGREPLTVPNVPEFYQRILTLPDAVFSPKPGAPAAGAPLPVFTVLYVYDRQKIGDATWLEVGAKAQGGGEGFLPESETQEWHSMLVMQYAPRAVRQRVLMFKDLDPLAKIVHADNGTMTAKQMLADVAAGKSDPDRVLAVEPATPVDYGKKPYVMPILDWKADLFADDTRTTLLQLASVNTVKPPPSPPAKIDVAIDVKKDETPPEPPTADLSDFKIGVVFLVDTTLSMQPYIDRVREAIQHIYHGLETDGTLKHVSLGLVAYRNNMDRDKRIEYVTRVYQVLDPNGDPKQFLAKLDGVQQSKVPTPGWDEDGFAGMYDALNAMDWTPYAARFMITVSDSGALRGTSPLVHYPGLDLENIVELANRDHVTFFPVHLLTPEGDRHQRERINAINEYRTLGTQTGDPSVDKYTPIPAGSVADFATTMNAFVDRIREAVKKVSENQLIKPAPSATAGGPATPAPLPDAAPGSASASATATATPSPTTDKMTQALVNEIFRAQIEYIGSKAGTTAPPFFKAWASDHDLTQPKYPALDVKVFLTRNQLNGLAESLSRILDAGKQATLAQDTFFNLLRSLSATMAGDPNRQVPGTFTNLADSNLLPSYLKILPYKSKLLRLSKETWDTMGITGQQELIDELDFKIKEYHDMYQDNKAWTDFGSGDAGQDVYPVPLGALP